jgi:prepilin-type N-terminal cleavage/methylation domain-containing protein
MSMKKKLLAIKYHGFSLSEVLIVMAIMSIMGGVGFVSLHTAKVNTRLRAAQREVTATIKEVQSYALQGRIETSAKVCGYGMRFTSKTEYQIFYKIAKPLMKCADTDYGSSTSVKEMKLADGVELSAPAYADTEIYFAIPFGEIYGPGDEVEFTGSTMTFRYPAGTGATKLITINSRGSIIENN